MTETWDQIFINHSCTKLQQFTERVCSCLDKLNQDQIWYRGSQNENAVGNLVLHLCGNIRQWIGFGVAGKPDVRMRDQEFVTRGGLDSSGLKERLSNTVAEAVAVIRALTPKRLEQPTSIQSYSVTVLQAVYHVVEHFAGHAGQIIFVTKHLTGQDLGFYSHLKPSQPHQEKAR